MNKPLNIIDLDRVRKNVASISACTLVSALCLSGPLLAQDDAPHGDHNPDHNGLVLMHLDLHFEVVTLSDGGIDLYFSSASRAPLPAAVVSDVMAEIERPGGSIQFVPMQISDTGDFWTGPSSPVMDPKTLVRVGFVFEAEPFFVDIPAAAFPPVRDHSGHMMDMSEYDAH